MKFKLLKKPIMAIILVVSMFLSTGCVVFDVDMGVDKNNTAYLTYRLEMDIEQFSSMQQHNFKQALYQLAVHFHENLGFSVVLSADDNPVVLTAEKKVQNNSFEQAFESLKNMLTDEDMTIFMQVDMAQANFPRQSGYIINATADIPKIIETNDFDNLPNDMEQSFKEAIRKSSGTIKISLPADALVNASHMTEIINDRANMEVPISFNDKTSLELSAIRNLQRSAINDVFDEFDIGAFVAIQLQMLFGDPNDSFINEHNRLRAITGIIVFMAVVIIILTSAIAIIVLIVQRRRYY